MNQSIVMRIARVWAIRSTGWLASFKVGCNQCLAMGTCAYKALINNIKTISLRDYFAQTRLWQHHRLKRQLRRDFYTAYHSHDFTSKPWIWTIHHKFDHTAQSESLLQQTYGFFRIDFKSQAVWLSSTQPLAGRLGADFFLLRYLRQQRFDKAIDLIMLVISPELLNELAKHSQAVVDQLAHIAQQCCYRLPVICLWQSAHFNQLIADDDKPSGYLIAQCPISQRAQRIQSEHQRLMARCYQHMLNRLSQTKTTADKTRWIAWPAQIQTISDKIKQIEQQWTSCELTEPYLTWQGSFFIDKMDPRFIQQMIDHCAPQAKVTSKHLHVRQRRIKVQWIMGLFILMLVVLQVVSHYQQIKHTVSRQTEHWLLLWQQIQQHPEQLPLVPLISQHFLASDVSIAKQQRHGIFEFFSPYLRRLVLLSTRLQLEQQIDQLRPLNKDASHYDIGHAFHLLECYLLLTHPQLTPNIASKLVPFWQLSERYMRWHRLAIRQHLPLTDLLLGLAEIKPPLGLSVDQQRIQALRQQLHQFSATKRLQGLLLYQGLQRYQAIHPRLGGSGLLMPLAGPCALFTPAIFKNYVQKQIKWMVQHLRYYEKLLGDYFTPMRAKDQQFLHDQIQHRYFKWYSHAWLHWLRHIKWRPLSDLRELHQKLEQHRRVIESLRQVLHDNIPSCRWWQRCYQDSALKPFVHTTHHFRPKWLKSYFQSLSGWDQAIKPIIDHRSSQFYKTAVEVLSEQSQHPLVKQSSLLANDYKTDSLKNLWLAPYQQSWQIILQQAASHLDHHWQHDVYSVFSNRLAGRFPLANQPHSITRQSFDAFFNPKQGVLARFIEQHLIPFLSHDLQQVKCWLGQGINLVPAWWQWWQQTRRLQQWLYADGQHLQGHIALYPIPMTGVASSRWMIDGQTINYRNEPQEWHGISVLHGQRPGVNLSIQKNGFDFVQHFAGDWGWWRLLQVASWQPLSDHQYQLHVNIHHKPMVRFKLKFDNNSVIQKNFFTHLNPPATIRSSL